MKEKIYTKKNHIHSDLADQYMFYIRQTNLHYDEFQYSLIKKLDHYINLILKTQSNFFLKANYLLLKKFNEKHRHIFYLHGNVGSGKSFITNLIFRTLPIKNERKLRFSFYEFIDTLRNELNKMNISSKNHANDSSPKQSKENFSHFIKKKIKNIDLLCIDEFHVLDISDAMIILEFFKVITSMPKLIVIINSNRAPEELYKNGIHRERFLPVIDLINRYSHVMLLSTKDYRENLTNNLKGFICFHESDDVKNPEDFYNIFKNLSRSLSDEIKKIKYEILSRKISFDLVQNAQYNYDYIFFNFIDFFSEPLYAKNYQKIFSNFKIKKIYINELIKLNDHDDLAKRFIAFVDVAYDMGIGLFIGSHVALTDLYTKGKVIFEFDRTISRINVLCR